MAAMLGRCVCQSRGIALLHRLHIVAPRLVAFVLPYGGIVTPPIVVVWPRLSTRLTCTRSLTRGLCLRRPHSSHALCRPCLQPPRVPHAVRLQFTRLLSSLGGVFADQTWAAMLFSAFDVNRDGTVDFRELCSGLSLYVCNEQNDK